MTSLRVLTGPCPPHILSRPEGHEGHGEHVACWNQTDVPHGLSSIPALLALRLPQVRSELVALVYELGRLRVPTPGQPGQAGQEVQEQLKAGADLSLWWCSLLFEKHPKVTADLYPALKARALEILIEEQGYSHIILDGKDEKLYAALSAFCAATGRIFCHENSLSNPEPRPDSKPYSKPVTGSASSTAKMPLLSRLRNWGRRSYYALPCPAKALLRSAAWWWTLRRHLPRTLSPSPVGQGGTAASPAQATIATYFPNIDPALAAQGRFRSRYWEGLHDALAASPLAPRVHWLFMLFPSPQYSTRQCLALRDTFAAQPEALTAGTSFHFVEEFLYTRDLAAACWRYLRLLCTSLRLQSSVQDTCHMRASSMNLWPWLSASFADSFRGWRCLERCLHNIAFERYVAWAGPQEWTIFPLENCPWERMLTHAVHTAKAGKVWGTQHSTVRPTDFRYFDDPRTFTDPDCALFQPDLVCGNGQGACHEMQAAGLPPDRMGMIEALRYMYLYEAMQGAAQPHAQTEQSSPPAKPRLLIVTSFFADEVADHMRVLADACRAGLLADWQVTLKAHPYLSVDSYLQELLPEHDFCLSTAPIGSLLTPGTLVWASNSTTVALEAALQGLSVMVQLPADDVDLCPLQSVAGVPRIANAEHVRAALLQPQQARIAPDYLALDPALPRWKKLLRL